MYRSPAGATIDPRLAVAAAANAHAAVDTGGIAASSVFCFLILPWPWRLVQGSGMILPVPRQCGQVCCTLKKPWRICTEPLPPQVPQVLGWVPGLAPLPWQVSQVSQLGMRISVDLPLAASSSVISMAYDRSLPRYSCRPPRPPAPRWPPNISPKISPKASASPNPPPPGPPPSAVGVHAGVAVLVVGRAFWAVGEHFVGLLGLFELLLGLLGLSPGCGPGGTSWPACGRPF